jgi:hypothetical protein
MKKDKASDTAYTVLQGVILCARQPKLTELVDAETVKAGEFILSASEEYSYWFCQQQYQTPVASLCQS